MVVEALPEGLNLSMSLKDIEETKLKSRVQQNKNLASQLIADRLSALLSGESFQNGYNLLELAQAFPFQDILTELIAAQTEESFQHVDKESQFLAFILPKVPTAKTQDAVLPFKRFYSLQKAPVVDNSQWGFRPEQSYSELINERVLQAIQFSYENNYVQLNRNEPFFVGLLVQINFAGPESTINVQLLGGLPTDTEFDFDQKEKEAHFKKIRMPRRPKLKWLSQQYSSHPGVIITASYQQSASQPLTLNIKFGSLGLVKGENWDLTRSPFENPLLEIDGITINSYMARYNTPHLWGEILAPLGIGALDWWLAREYNIKMNIHEVSLDLATLKISDIRVLTEFERKPEFLSWSVLRLPTIEQQAVNDQFVAAANKQLEPYQKQVENIKTSLETQGLVYTLLKPEVQKQFLTLLNQALGTEVGGTP